MAGMRRLLPAGLLAFLVAATAFAQPSTIGPRDIRCADCSQSGQKPATAGFDASQIEFVADPVPAFFENRTIRYSVIARVLQPAPLILDVLDARVQTLDRNILLLSLPIQANTLDDGDRDPNRLVYFLQAGRLYRVARPFFCTDTRACTFRELNAAEVAEPMFGSCESGTMNCQTTIYPGGRRVYTRSDPSLTAMSGRLWPRSMGVKLRDVPPSGLTFSTDEYNRQKAIYSPIMKFRQFGSNFIEQGILYAHVRVCLIEEGDDPAACETDTPKR